MNFIKLEEKEKKKNEIALFRYALIAPLVTNTYSNSSKMDYFREISSKKHILNNHEVEISPGTIKRWYMSYTKDGFNSLIPKTRCDINTSRILNEEIKTSIKEYRAKYPYITGTLIYQKLKEDGLINFDGASKATVLRYIRDNNLKTKQTAGCERLAFEMEYANELWQADTSHGIYINNGGKKQLTFLIQIIDDKSRLIVGYGFFFNDNAYNFQCVLKQAIKKYGVPKRIYTDNGSSYKNQQLSLIVANIGSSLLHTRAYDPESKAKIERSFGTIKSGWMNGCNWDDFKTLDDLNTAIGKFINNYNNSIHSSLDNTPNNIWFKDYYLIKKLDNDVIDESFMHSVFRKIRIDCIGKVCNMEFEVPNIYVGKKINIKYNPSDLSVCYIYEQGKKVCEIKEVNKVDNSKRARKPNIWSCTKSVKSDII